MTKPIEINSVQLKQPSHEKDRHGFTYEQLLAVQSRHLTWWEQLLRPEHHAKLKQFCERTNKPAVPGAQWPHGAHSVARGVELVQFLQQRAQFLLDDEDPIEWGRDHVPNSVSK